MLYKNFSHAIVTGESRICKKNKKTPKEIYFFPLNLPCFKHKPKENEDEQYPLLSSRPFRQHDGGYGP